MTHFGYIALSMVHCYQIDRWIPVSVTWMANLTTECHKQHFLLLMGNLNESDLSMELIDELLKQVMDYSAALQAGFEDAYAETFFPEAFNEGKKRAAGNFYF